MSPIISTSAGARSNPPLEGAMDASLKEVVPWAKSGIVSVGMTVLIRIISPCLARISGQIAAQWGHLDAVIWTIGASYRLL